MLKDSIDIVVQFFNTEQHSLSMLHFFVHLLDLYLLQYHL